MGDVFNGTFFTKIFDFSYFRNLFPVSVVVGLVFWDVLLHYIDEMFRIVHIYPFLAGEFSDFVLLLLSYKEKTIHNQDDPF